MALLLAAAAAGAAEDGVSADAVPMRDGEVEEAPPVQGAADLSGDVRWRLRDVRPRSSSFQNAAPSLQHSPYVYQRVRAHWKERLEAGVLAVRPVPGPSLAAGDLRRRGVVKGFAAVPGRAVVGDYSLSFGQGLMFYDGLGEFVRPAWTQGRGVRGNLSTMADEHLRGATVRVGADGSLLLFASRAALDMPLNPDGTGAAPLWSLREGVFLEDEEDVLARNTVTEKLAGLRLEAKGGGGRVAATAARVRYGPALAPALPAFGAPAPFRGSRLSLWGADGAWKAGAWRAAVDVAFSAADQRRGRGWAATLYREEEGAALWAGLFGYDGGYFSRLGKGPAFEVSDPPAALPLNQRGLGLGARMKGGSGSVEGEAAWARFPAGMGNGRNADPLFPSQGRRWRLEGLWRATPEWELSAAVQGRARERYAAPSGGGRTQGEEDVRRGWVQSVWQASPRVRIKCRLSGRWEREPFTGRRAEGKFVMAEARWSPSEIGAVTARWYSFHSPAAFLTAGVEEIWDGVAAPRLAGGMGTLRGAPGERYALMGWRRWGPHLRTWMKYDGERRWRGETWSGGKHAWHLQTDLSW